MKKKVISLILAATMVATMATGCGNSSGETTTTDNAASTTTDAAAPATEASDTAAAATEAAGGDYADKKVGVCTVSYTHLRRLEGCENRAGRTDQSGACLCDVALCAGDI